MPFDLPMRYIYWISIKYSWSEYLIDFADFLKYIWIREEKSKNNIWNNFLKFY